MVCIWKDLNDKTLSLKLNFNPFLFNSCHGQRHLPLDQVAQSPQVEVVAFKRIYYGAVQCCIHSQIWCWLKNETSCQHPRKIPCLWYFTRSLLFSSSVIRKRHKSVWIASKKINQQLTSSYGCHAHAAGW